MNAPSVNTAAAGAAARWRRLFERQALESARLRALRDAYPAPWPEAQANPVPSAMVDGPAEDPITADRDRAIGYDDPFLLYVRKFAGDQTTVLDAGAGNGRLALALAAQVAEVVAVDPDVDALRELELAARHLGISNVRIIGTPVEAPGLPPCDLAMSAFVLDTLRDAAPFLASLDRLARHRVLVCTTAQSTFAPYQPVWCCFHPEPRQLGPSHLDAAAIVRELGGEPVVHTILRALDSESHEPDYGSIDEAAGYYEELLLLPPTPEVRRRLRDILPDWLSRVAGGYVDPVPPLPYAVIEWAPREARDERH